MPRLLLSADRTRRKSIAIGKARMMWRLMRWSVPLKRDDNGSWPCISFECLGWQRGENGRKHTQNQQSCGRCRFWTKTRHDLEKNSAFLQEKVCFCRKTLHFSCVFSTLTNLGDLEKGSWVVAWYFGDELLTQFGRKDHYFGLSHEIIWILTNQYFATCNMCVLCFHCSLDSNFWSRCPGWGDERNFHRSGCDFLQCSAAEMRFNKNIGCGVFLTLIFSSKTS